MTHVSDLMRGSVGGVLRRRVSYPVSKSDIRRWALAVYHPERPPQSLIEAWTAPLEFNPFAWVVADDDLEPGIDPVDPDRNEHMLGVPGPRLQFQLNGGLEVRYGVPMRPDDTITSVSRLVEYREREGRLGLMLITVTEDTWTNQNDDQVKVTRGTLIRY